VAGLGEHDSGGRGLPVRYWVQYVGPAGRHHRDPLSAVAHVRFEAVPPVRGFPRFQGQRNNTGLWWSATVGAHVGFESWLERDHLTLLDFDPAVVAISSQPMRLWWNDDGRWRSHVPDYFARRVDGTGAVVDVRPAGRVGARDAVVFAATGAACVSAGWAFELVHEPDAVLMANVRWLAGYRHPRCHRPQLWAAVRDVFTEATPLMAGAAAIGDPLFSLPALFHLLWRGRLHADLTVPLSEWSLVEAEP
jgi:hypothetical protein